MSLIGKAKKREPLYLSKIDVRVTKKIKKEAKERNISPWLLIEYLLTEAIGIEKNAKPSSILFRKT